MRNKYISLAINKLGIDFDSLDLTFHQMDNGMTRDVTSYCPGPEDECYIGQPYSGYALRANSAEDACHKGTRHSYHSGNDGGGIC